MNFKGRRQGIRINLLGKRGREHGLSKRPIRSICPVAMPASWPALPGLRGATTRVWPRLKVLVEGETSSIDLCSAHSVKTLSACAPAR